MAPRNVFEVVSLKFIFDKCGRSEWSKEEFVREGLNKYLNAYTWNTSFKYCCASLEGEEFVVDVEFSKGVPFIIVINILDNMYLGTDNMLSIEYKERDKMVTVSSC